MLSDKYSRFCIASLCSRTSPRICASAAAIALVSLSGGAANPLRAANPASITTHNHTATRLKRILTLTFEVLQPACHRQAALPLFRYILTPPRHPHPYSSRNGNYLFDVRDCLLRFAFFLVFLARRGASWHSGQKWLPLPATIIFSIFVLHRKHLLPSRPYTL